MTDIQFLELTPGLYGFIACFSLAIGSVLNVFIYRLPRMLQAELLTDCHFLLKLPPSPPEKINLFFPRSFCPHCKQTIRFFHNIPLLSYMILQGRCATCRGGISLRYPLVEGLNCILCLYATWHFGFTLTLLFAWVFIWILIILCFIDFKHQLLPDTLTLSLLWLGLIANIYTPFTRLPTAILSAVGAYLILWLFIKLFFLFTGKVGMGNGDFKLYAAFGAWFGWSQLPLILIISCALGTIIGGGYLLIKRYPTNTTLPFGPFLCLAGIISLFWGETLFKIIY